MSKRVIFFSSVKDVNLFNITGFYSDDIAALRQAGHTVICTNKFIIFFKFWSYDVAFLYFYKKSILPALIARFLFKKIIFTGGIDDLSEYVSGSRFKKFVHSMLFRLNYMLSDVCNIVSVSDMENVSVVLRRAISPSFSKLSFNTHCVNTSVESGVFIYGKQDIITTICWMGSCDNVKRKGVDKTIYLFKKIVSVLPDFKLYIIGALGQGSHYLKGIVINEGLEGSVVFTGSISSAEKVFLLSRSKYYFQLSLYEGFGMAVVEAMILKNIIFHSGRGGLKDTVGPRGYILNITDASVDELLHNFLEVHNLYQENVKIIESNALYVANKFSIANRVAYFKVII